MSTIKYFSNPPVSFGINGEKKSNCQIIHEFFSPLIPRKTRNYFPETFLSIHLGVDLTSHDSKENAGR
jgi:hypothetical protein